MRENKFISKIAITSHPPTFKFEYTKGRCRNKYHKHVRLEEYFNGLSIGRYNDSTDRSTYVVSIVTSLLEKHDELHQVSEELMEQVIEKLLLNYISNQNSNNGGKPTRSEADVIACERSTFLLRDNTHAAQRRIEWHCNLNEAPEKVLSIAKGDMDKVFEKNFILPNSDGYKYDKRVNFHPDEDSSWD